MERSAQPSPWWYRRRVGTIALLYCSSVYLAYGIADVLHLPVQPLYASFGTPHERGMLALAALLAALGWLLRAWGTEYLRPAIVWNRDARAEAFYVAGPFRYTRNPLYLGNLCVAAAIGFFVPPIGWPIVVFAQWAFVRALIAEEERRLRSAHGDVFESYCRSVPRLLPRPVPVSADEAPHAKLWRATVAEIFSASFALSLFVLAAFGMHAWRGALIVVAFGVAAQSVVRSAPLRL